MKIFQDVPACPDHNDGFVFGYLYDIIADDQFVGVYLYLKHHIRIIQCGSFHSSVATTGKITRDGNETEYSYFDKAISFHWITEEWLEMNKLENLQKHYNIEDTES